MHRPRNADHAGAAPAGGSSFNGDHGVKAASGSVKADVRVQVPLISPLSIAHKAKASSHRFANPSYPVRVRGAHPFPSGPEEESNPPVWGTGESRSITGWPDHFGAIVQQQDSVMAWRRSGCDSPWFHFRARGRQQSAPFGSARHSGQHRGARPISIPPRRRQRRTSSVMTRDRRKSGWRIF